MNHFTRSFLLLIISFVLLNSCSKKPDKAAQTDGASLHRMADEDAAVSTPEAAAKMASDNKKEDNGPMGGNDQRNGTLGPAGFLPPQLKLDRLLEYSVSLNYQTTDFLKTRQLIYAIIARRGFVRNSSASIGKPSGMSVQFAVRASDLFDVIKELDQAGDLLHESISTIDHTEKMQEQKIKLRREDLRGTRRTIALTGDPASKNWAERDAALERSEDAKDVAEMEQWRIQDRIQWASISVNIEGPAAPTQVEVPQYRNAFVGLLNFFLSLIYYVIYLLPIAALLLALYVAYRKIAPRFKKG